jgi:hypothetical protein
MDEYILSEDLAVWFGKKKKKKGSKQPKGPWVNICRKKKGGGHPTCGRKDADKGGYPVCRAAGVASKMSQSAKDSACRRKREKEKNDGKSGKGQTPSPIKIKNYKKKKSKNESISLKNIIKGILNESLHIDSKKKYFVDKSQIHGKGVFAKKILDENETVGLLHTINNSKDYTFTELGKLHNHSEEPNCHNELINNQRFLVASKPINIGDELTTNYRLQPDLEQPEDWVINESGEREMIPEIDGYRTYSPFKDLEYIIVNSNGIDCNNIVYDLILVGDNGLIKYGPKDSGSHFLNGAKKVVELPLKNNENGEELVKNEKRLKQWVFDKIKTVDKDLEIRKEFFNETTDLNIKKYKNESMNLKNIIREGINNMILQKNVISEELKYHFENNISITDNIFRHGSDKYFDIVNEARELHRKGYSFNDFDIEILESEVGTFVNTTEGKIPLDFPFQYEDTLNEGKKKKKKDPPIGKPKSGGSKKWYVYVRNPKTGKIKKISYGSSTMTAKWNDPAARKSFAARHQCHKKKDRTKAGYWACRAHKDFGKNVSGRYW